MSVHSNRVRDISATRSPGWIPAAIRPAATARTWPANSRQVTGCQVPCSFRFRPTEPGQFSALVKRSSVTLSFGFTTYAAGTEISCIGAPDQRFSTLSSHARYDHARHVRAEGPECVTAKGLECATVACGRTRPAAGSIVSSSPGGEIVSGATGVSGGPAGEVGEHDDQQSADADRCCGGGRGLRYCRARRESHDQAGGAVGEQACPAAATESGPAAGTAVPPARPGNQPGRPR